MSASLDELARAPGHARRLDRFRARIARWFGRLDDVTQGLVRAVVWERDRLRTALVIALGLRVLALVAQVFRACVSDGSDDERFLYLEYVRSAAEFGLSSPAYLRAAVLWHLPLPYVLWSTLLAPGEHALTLGRSIGVSIWLASAAVWVMLWRMVLPRVSAALALVFFCLAPTWHTVEIRAYPFMLLLVLTTTYLALVPLCTRRTLPGFLAAIALPLSLGLLVQVHLYAFIACGVLAVAGVALLAFRRATGWLYLGAVALAVAVAVPTLENLFADRAAAWAVVWKNEQQSRIETARAKGEPMGDYVPGVLQISDFDTLALDVKKKAVGDAGIVLLGSLALVVWIRGGSSRCVAVLAVLAALPGSANLFPHVILGSWLARRGRRWRDWHPSWVLVLALGCLPGVLVYPIFFENYLTGFRVLPFLLAADVLRERRWDWPARLVTLHVLAYLSELLRWLTGSPISGPTPW